MSNTIGDAYLLPQPNRTEIKEANDTILGKNDFLRILIAQLQNQDPLNPMEDREFIAQMASFSTLEQMTNMSSAMERFVAANDSNALVSHSELIGKKITWEKVVQIDDYRTDVEVIENIVTAVKRESDGSIRLQLDDGGWILSNQLVEISQVEEKEQEKDGDEQEEGE